MKRITILALCALAILPLLFSCTKTDSSIKKVESIRIYTVGNQGELVKDVTGTTIDVKGDYTKQWFAVKFTPSDATDHTFDVDATGGLSVVVPVVEAPIENKFTVTFTGNGSSVVTATTTDGKKTASITFNVSGM